MSREHLDWEVTVSAWRHIVIALDCDVHAIDLDAVVKYEGSDDRLAKNWQARHSLETGDTHYGLCEDMLRDISSMILLANHKISHKWHKWLGITVEDEMNLLHLSGDINQGRKIKPRNALPQGTTQLQQRSKLDTTVKSGSHVRTPTSSHTSSTAG